MNNYTCVYFCLLIVMNVVTGKQSNPQVFDNLCAGDRLHDNSLKVSAVIIHDYHYVLSRG